MLPRPINPISIPVLPNATAVLAGRLPLLGPPPQGGRRFGKTDAIKPPLATIISLLILSLLMKTYRTKNREILFLISDVGRLLRTYADQKARRFGQTRAQWAVLLQLERREGLKQSDLAENLDIQPITLTRLVDRLCDNGLIERRADPNDRRAKRLYLTAAARPLLDRIADEVEVLAEEVLAGITPEGVNAILSQLGMARDNLKQAIAGKTTNENTKETVKHDGRRHQQSTGVEDRAGRAADNRD